MELAEYMAMKKRMTEFNRVWGCLIDCRGCPLFFDNNGRGLECRKFEVLYPEEAEAKLTQWAKGHPAKTLLQDFQEKYPDFDKDAVGNPRICPAWLGYKNYCCDSKKATYNQCTECWNQPVKEG